MSARFDLVETPFADLHIVKRKPIKDGRGHFERLFCLRELETFFAPSGALQVNHTFTKERGAVRGLHFQRPPHSEVKLVNCIQGEVFDVVVDLRKDSPTFLQIYTQKLSPENNVSILIPKGFAHGFQTLSSDCRLIYFHSEYFHAEAESGLNILDPLLSIDWPLPLGNISVRDKSHGYIDDTFSGIEL